MMPCYGNISAGYRRLRTFRHDLRMRPLKVIGYDRIRTGLIDEVKISKFYAFLADEVSAHSNEHLAVSLRFDIM